MTFKEPTNLINIVDYASNNISRKGWIKKLRTILGVLLIKHDDMIFSIGCILEIIEAKDATAIDSALEYQNYNNNAVNLYSIDIIIDIFMKIITLIERLDNIEIFSVEEIQQLFKAHFYSTHRIFEIMLKNYNLGHNVKIKKLKDEISKLEKMKYKMNVLTGVDDQGLNFTLNEFCEIVNYHTIH